MLFTSVHRILTVILVFAIITDGSAQEVGIVESNEPPHWLIDYSKNKTDEYPERRIKTAWLSVWSRSDAPIHLYAQNDQCFGCILERVFSIQFENESQIIQIQSSHRNYIQIQESINNTHTNSICKSKIGFAEEGDYWIVVNPDSDEPCILYLLNDPPNIYLPIAFTFLVLFLIALASIGINVVLRQNCTQNCLSKLQSKNEAEFSSTNTLELKETNDTATNNNQKATEGEVRPQKPRRLTSLDTFRGISLVIMIFVNYGGGAYWFFEHVEWNGLAVADLVFPWFVFIMGTAMAFSFRSMKKKRIPVKRVFFKVIKRTCLLFLIGLSLNSQSGVLLEELRIPGVLQRLALCYFMVAVPQIFFARSHIEGEGKLYWFRDITDYWGEWIIHLSLLATYLCLTFLLPVPGCPPGYLGPGGLHNGGQYFNCSGGAAGYIDKVILGNDHIYQGATFKALYKATESYDPEGILGTLCAAFMCFLGLQVGKIILYHKSHRHRVIRWFLWAIVTGSIAALLCKGSQNDGWVPINKNLWSLSFTLALSSMAFLMLSILYIITDVYHFWLGAPFLYPGMNSLIVYIGHSVFGTFFPIRWRVSTDDHWHQIAMTTWATGIWCIVAFIMFRRNVFVTL